MMYVFVVFLLLASCVYGGVNVSDPFSAFTWIHGSNGTITVEQLENFFSKISYNKTEYAKQLRRRVEAISSSCPTCYLKCENVSEILSKYGLDSKTTLSADNIEAMAPGLFYRLQNPFCSSVVDEKRKAEKPPTSEVWGYSLAMVTIINFCALLGFAFTPFMGRRVYKLILAFMIALAVGSLAGSAVLFLLPDALQLSEMEQLMPDKVSYIWKSTVVMGGIYMFFLLERFLKCMIERKVPLPQVKSNTSCSMNIRRPPDSDAALKEMPQRHDSCGEPQIEASSSAEETDDVEASPGQESKKAGDYAYAAGKNINSPGNGRLVSDSSSRDGLLTKVAPVAWMIIFGDGVHNFIDGLSIGAAFSHNIVSGFSLSVAVLCEELPHELGDFAILLNSGMSMKLALLFNFLSACMCYVGLIVGILVGENTQSAVWIFAIAAGMFLYISLVDMMPEVNHFIESDEGKEYGRVKIFVIQNIGLYMGYGLLLLMAVYGDNIRF